MADLERQRRYSLKLEHQIKAHKNTIQNQAIALEKVSHGDLFNHMQEELTDKEVVLQTARDENLALKVGMQDLKAENEDKHKKLFVLHDRLVKMKKTFKKVTQVVPNLNAENERLRVELKTMMECNEMTAEQKKKAKDGMVYLSYKKAFKRIKNENSILKKELKKFAQEDSTRNQMLRSIREKLTLVKKKMKGLDVEKIVVRNKIESLESEKANMRKDMATLKIKHDIELKSLKELYEDQLAEKNDEQITASPEDEEDEQTAAEKEAELKDLHEQLEWYKIELYNKELVIGDWESKLYFKNKLVEKLESDLDGSQDKSRRYFMKIQEMIDEQNAARATLAD